MKILLEGWGCAVHTAAGLDDIARIKMRPDLVIADFHLSEGTGIDAIRELRRKFGADLLAILVTADRTPAVRDAAEAASITVMHKPLKPAALRALLAQWRATEPREIETV
jgi:CheY-like chemotaxis protein